MTFSTSIPASFAMNPIIEKTANPAYSEVKKLTMLIIIASLQNDKVNNLTNNLEALTINHNAHFHFIEVPTFCYWCAHTKSKHNFSSMSQVILILQTLITKGIQVQSSTYSFKETSSVFLTCSSCG